MKRRSRNILDVDKPYFFLAMYSISARLSMFPSQGFSYFPVLIQRKDKITGLEESIEAATKEVEDKEAAYASGIKEARAKGMQAKESLLNEAADEERQIIEKINEKAQAELAKVRDQVAKEADDARTSLMQEIDGFAEAIGQKILGRAI